MTTTDDTAMDLDPADDIDPTTEHRDFLQREVDRLTDAINEARALKAAAAASVKSLIAQRTPLERAIRAMTPRNQRD